MERNLEIYVNSCSGNPEAIHTKAFTHTANDKNPTPRLQLSSTSSVIGLVQLHSTESHQFPQSHRGILAGT